MTGSERGNSNRKKGWIRKRHSILRRLFGPAVGAFAKMKYGVNAETFHEQNNRAYLILYNHQTPFDQFFVMMSFKGPVYYLATEDIFSKGIISSIIRWAVAPIPIRKYTQDIHAMRTMLKVAKEGGTIAIAPEGNRTYSGKTEYINPSIAHLAKALKMPIALYCIEGGYGVQPRWSDKTRKGRMHAYVSKVIEPEEIDLMSENELYDLIKEGLYVNDSENGGTFASKRQAEYIERMVYVCPFCGFSRFKSSGNEIECQSCHRKIRYHDDMHMEGAGYDFPFRFANDWYEYQEEFINGIDITVYKEQPVFQDTADIYEVIPYRKKVCLYKGMTVSLYGDRITLEGANEFHFDKIEGAAVLGRNKLNIYHGKKIYQFKGDKSYNSLKYMNFIYRFKNIVSGDINGKFLGL